MPRSQDNEELSPQSTPERRYGSISESDVPEVRVAGRSGQQNVETVDERSASDRGGLLPEGGFGMDGTGDRDVNDDGIDADRLLVYGAKQIIRLFVPVSLCMIFVVVIIYSVSYYTRNDGYLPYTPFHSENADTGTKLWENLSNALIFIGIIIVVTILIVLLYKYKCYKLIYGWLVFTSLFLLFLFSFIFIRTVCHTLGVFVDTVSFVLLLWNFGVIGMITLYWKAPLVVQQGYLLLVSAEMALFFIKYFPDWTVWFLLGLLAVWDLIAVLCPKGPLRLLVEMAMERQETLMPAMIYSTTAVWALMADRDRTPTEAEEGGFHDHVINAERANRVRDRVANEELSASSVRARSAVSALNGHDANDSGAGAAGNDVEVVGASRTARSLREIQDEVMSREDRGVKLGLGDFVFYSVLVGKASTLGDWNTTLACYVAILIGMCFTLLLLAIRGHALPALPISIFFGLIFYFCTSLIITPFTSLLADQQVFI